MHSRYLHVIQDIKMVVLTDKEATDMKFNFKVSNLELA